MDWLLRIVYEECLVSDIGRVYLMEIGYKSRWWGKCNNVCEKFGMWELLNSPDSKPLLPADRWRFGCWFSVGPPVATARGIC